MSIFQDEKVQKAFIQGVDLFQGARRITMLQDVGRSIGVTAESVISEYPVATHNPLPYFYTRHEAFGKPTKPYLSKFKSDKQAFKVRMLGKLGKLPYRRTGTLQKSISSRVVTVDLARVVTQVGTNLEYGSEVLDEQEQSYYHQGTWNTLQDDLRKGIIQYEIVAIRVLRKHVVEAFGE